MNRVAFVFIRGPHGNSSGREGLDALLATSVLTKNVGVFFIADGVFLLLPQQQPEKILARNFIATFGVLSLYNISNLYLCSDSVAERGLNVNISWVISVKCLSAVNWRRHLVSYDRILTF